MSGFEADWLSLREPADRSARDRRLLAAAVDHISSSERAVVDLGSGTGSTFRALDPLLGTDAPWVFVDDDTALLARAQDMVPSDARSRVRLHRADLAGLDDALFDSAGLVTASALFDLVSLAFIQRFAARMAHRGLATYAALTVDGRVIWDSPHELDRQILAAFAADQRRDKGFGPGLGGEAAAALESAFRDSGFDVQAAESDWQLTGADLALQDAFYAGLAAPSAATLPEASLADWLEHRARTAMAGAGVRVGHRDMLALPPG